MLPFDNPTLIRLALGVLNLLAKCVAKPARPIPGVNRAPLFAAQRNRSVKFPQMVLFPNLAPPQNLEVNFRLVGEATRPFKLRTMKLVVRPYFNLQTILALGIPPWTFLNTAMARAGKLPQPV